MAGQWVYGPALVASYNMYGRAVGLFYARPTLALYLCIITLDGSIRQAVGNESNLGFTLDRSQSRRHPAKIICDTEFADDIAQLSNTLEQARLLLSRVGKSAKQTGLHINNSIT